MFPLTNLAGRSSRRSWLMAYDLTFNSFDSPNAPNLIINHDILTVYTMSGPCANIQLSTSHANTSKNAARGHFTILTLFCLFLK